MRQTVLLYRSKLAEVRAYSLVNLRHEPYYEYKPFITERIELSSTFSAGASKNATKKAAVTALRLLSDSSKIFERNPICYRVAFENFTRVREKTVKFSRPSPGGEINNSINRIASDVYM